MKRIVLLFLCLGAACLLIINALAGVGITIASNDLRVYCGPLLESIWSAATAAFLLVIVAIGDKTLILRLFSLAGVLPVIFVVYEFLHRYHPPYCGEP